MRANRRDANHHEIFMALYSAGFYVWDCADMKNGFPDIMAVSKSGVPVLFEVKVKGGKLTPAEKLFHESYPGKLYIVYSAEEAIRIMEEL